MPWTAQLLVIRDDPGAQIDKRNRRGEIIDIHDVTGDAPYAPEPGTKSVFIFVTDVPDAWDINRLKGKLLEPQLSTNEVHLTVQVSGDFIVGETITGPTGTAVIDAVKDAGNQQEIEATVISGTLDTPGELVGSSDGLGTLRMYRPRKIGRKKRFIPVSLIPPNVRNQLLNNGFYVTDFTTVRNFIRRRFDNQYAVDFNDNDSVVDDLS